MFSNYSSVSYDNIFKVCQFFCVFRQSKKPVDHFALRESLLIFQRRKDQINTVCKKWVYSPICSLMCQSVNLLWTKEFKMLVVFSPIFVAETKIIVVHNFAALLSLHLLNDALQLFSAVCRRIALVCLTILWGSRLKG